MRIIIVTIFGNVIILTIFGNIIIVTIFGDIFGDCYAVFTLKTAGTSNNELAWSSLQ